MLLTDFGTIGAFAFALAGLFVLVFDRETLRLGWWAGVRLLVARFFGLWWALSAIALLFKVRTIFLNMPGDPFEAVNLVPFETISLYLRARNWVQILGNLFVLFPMPLLLRANFPKCKTKTLLWISLAVAVLIEPAQLVVNIVAGSPANAIDIDDFLLNGLGCLLGLGIVGLLGYATARKETVALASAVD